MYVQGFKNVCSRVGEMTRQLKAAAMVTRASVFIPPATYQVCHPATHYQFQPRGIQHPLLTSVHAHSAAHTINQF